MRTAFLLALVAIFAASLAFAQAGPKQTEKAKPDTTKTDQKTEKPVKSKAEVEKPAKAKSKAEDPAKSQTKAEKPAESKTRPEKEKSARAKTKPEKKPGVAKKEIAGSPGRLKRALFTTAIEEREPVGSVDSLSTATEQIYFYTELVGMQGHTITHRWSHGGEVRAEVPITVGSPRWRAYSSKKLLRGWTGEWKVDVVDADGNVLATKRFVYYGE